MSFTLALAQVAPWYNLALVAITVALFIKLFTTTRKNRAVYLFPWKIIFFALCVYIVEEVLTVLRYMEIINIPRHINGFFELIIIISFIYALLSQKEHMK
jgi:hypothetical protein